MLEMWRSTARSLRKSSSAIERVTRGGRRLLGRVRRPGDHPAPGALAASQPLRSAGNGIRAALERAARVAQVRGLAVDDDMSYLRAEREAGQVHGADPVDIADVTEPLERAGLARGLARARAQDESQIGRDR